MLITAFSQVSISPTHREQRRYRNKNITSVKQKLALCIGCGNFASRSIGGGEGRERCREGVCMGSL